MSSLRSRRLVPAMKPLSTKRSTIVSTLDIGSSKICCMIARLTPTDTSQVLPGRTHGIEIIGLGHQRSRGIKSGVVTDLDQAEQAIRQAVDAAERMAGVTIQSLIVNVSAGRLFSEAFSADVDIGGYEIRSDDIIRVLGAGAQNALAKDRLVVHSLPVGYTLDGQSGILDPRGMIGSRLGVDMHVLTADAVPLQNLELCLNRAHLSVETMVATPYASGLAVMVDDEMEMGSACIDMGGGTTTISVFLNGRFIFCDAIAIGGNHVTMDIARGLSTRLEHAERIKVLYGSVLSSDRDHEDFIKICGLRDDEGDNERQISRAQLTRIIRPRVEETLELIRDRLIRSGFGEAVGKRIVLTGGACQLDGVDELARRILSKQVRIGRPMGTQMGTPLEGHTQRQAGEKAGINGMPGAAKTPGFATAAGLLVYPQMAQLEFQLSPGDFEPAMTGTGGPFHAFSQWLKESF